LEVECIIGNPKLRHDINFDRELHFRPNLDGDRGRRKLQQAEDYWHALQDELEKYAYMLGDARGVAFRHTPEWMAEFKRSEVRVPRLFEAAKEILRSLTPDREVPGADGVLHVPHILQQIEHGVFDLHKLGHWLANLLKAHCAPMRDQWVERMVELLERGGKTFSAKTIVEGFKELFGIMEAMKLDIANHQIRYFRHMLLENTVRFERRYYAGQIIDGRVNSLAAQNWIRGLTPLLPIPAAAADSSTDSHVLPSPPNTPQLAATTPVLTRPTLKVFAARLIASLLSTNPTLPETFTLDHDRLLLLRCDAHAIIYTEIILHALSFLLSSSRSSPGSSAYALRARAYLRDFLPILIGRGASDARWASKIASIAPEVVRAAFGPIPDFDGSGTVRHANPAAETSEAKPDQAMLASQLETYFAKHLNPTSSMFRNRADALQERLTTNVTTDCLRFEHISAREVGDVLLAPRSKCSTTITNFQSSSDAPIVNLPTAMDIDHQLSHACSASSCAKKPTDAADEAFTDVAARLTHIASLHWKIWAPLVYLRKSDEAIGNVMEVEWEGFGEGWGAFVRNDEGTAARPEGSSDVAMA